MANQVRDVMVIVWALTIGLLISGGMNVYQTEVIANLTAELAGHEEYLENQIENERLIEELRQKLDRYKVSPEKGKKIAPILMEYSTEYNVDANLIMAQIQVESHWKPWARSEAGARGLMQVMPFWVDDPEFQRRTGITKATDLYTVDGSLRAGTSIIAYYIELCGGLEAGLRCYHGGPRAKMNPRPSTTAYVNKVMGYYKGYV